MKIKDKLKAFFRGMSSLNIWPNVKYSYFKSDEEAIKNDWEMVGKDMKDALKKFRLK